MVGPLPGVCPLVTGQLRALARGLSTGVTREGPLPPSVGDSAEPAGSSARRLGRTPHTENASPPGGAGGWVGPEAQAARALALHGGAALVSREAPWSPHSFSPMHHALRPFLQLHLPCRSWPPGPRCSPSTGTSPWQRSALRWAPHLHSPGAQDLSCVCWCFTLTPLILST